MQHHDQTPEEQGRIDTNNREPHRTQARPATTSRQTTRSPIRRYSLQNFHPNRLVFSMNEIVASIIILFVQIFRLSLPYKSKSHKFFDSMSVISKSFETCLRHGLFPEIWKHANVVLVHKKNEKNLKGNYRPISLLPIFGKILEKLVYDSETKSKNCDDNHVSVFHSKRQIH